ncbi:hypothetical protein MCHIJ_23850 [Mycolicibacterium chitae]|uniref:Serine protease n=1 Tax=Mycolicibacterium chitae TaxID=1792 RepID=A0A448I0V9_MYCCI|nr:hypothetical protein [Mycolicibacterium chitae]MCV7107646.1 hypothetical protein [Mycolicibacterium chitae]BBZ02948.1 hypothetical protein MCHIJ_23850 [Mycolicibacterium chitae]VEG46004.1 Uncharacterised protein [Mycolicibacterium chitae]
MKKTLLSSAVIGGLAALTIGVAAPAFAAPTILEPGQVAQSVGPDNKQFPRIQNNTEKVDQRNHQRFNTEVSHPYYGSPGSVAGGPIVGRR